jgi:hypothetical protein
MRRKNFLMLLNNSKSLLEGVEWHFEWDEAAPQALCKLRAALRLDRSFVENFINSISAKAYFACQLMAEYKFQGTTSDMHNELKLILGSFGCVVSQVTSSGKAILITGCESPLAWYLCKKLDDIGFTVFAGFKDVAENADAELLKDECSARVKVLQIDSSSETQVSRGIKASTRLGGSSFSFRRCMKR